MNRARLRRMAPHVLGLSLACVLLWQGSSELEQAAEQSESFTVLVDELSPVFDLDAPPRPWTAEVDPQADALRTTWLVDDRPLRLEIGELGEVAATLDQLLGPRASVPGWHFIEARVDRRGGRREAVIDPLLVGRFGHASDDPAARRTRCDVALSASQELVEALVVPLFEAQALPKLRENQHMGPDTELREAKLELREHTVHFELELAGENTLAVSGLVAIWVDDARQLHLHLVLLDEVDFEGELRTQAQSVGAGGGALLGGLIAGPLAPVGALAGWWLADEYVTDKARDVVRKQIDEGLSKLSGVELLPASIELLPGEPRSRVELGFCERTAVQPGGLVAGLWIKPSRDASTRFDLGVPGPLITGAQPSFVALDQEGNEDLRLELSIDLVNALLTEWTRSGLLLDVLQVPRMLEHANLELHDWTPMRLDALRPTRPPLLSPAGGPEQGWSFGLGGLVVDTSGGEQPWGTIRVGGEGTLQPLWDPGAGTLRLSGSLDRLAVGCVQPAGDRAALRPCFASVLEAVELRERLDAHLRPDAQGMPALELRALLAEKLSLAIGGLELSRPLPGVLRLSADVVLP
ncbi:hypothetical protein ACNOYE_13630 [Nannocystaceae bacterium ST9]